MSVDELMADSSWQSLPAVQNKQVYRMPKYFINWELPVPESILGTLWLQSTFYPEQVTYDLHDEIISFYKEFYDLDLSSTDVDTILADQSPIVVKKPAT
jgi:iron complex transport system substrate-binding protein